MSTAFAVVMAGGAGTRFWPLSRKSRPKQLLPLGPGNESLIAACIRRVQSEIHPDRTLVVTTEPLVNPTLRKVPQIPRANILGEPIGRNTAACVGWATLHARARDPDALIAVLPADAHIGDEQGYGTCLRTALEVAAQGVIVTIGIKPTRPEVGYGYVEVGDAVGHGTYRVRRFVEKPDLARAEQFVRSGTHLWNSGMFFFKASIMLEAIDQHLPELGNGLKEIEAAMRKGREKEALHRIYPSLPAISLDHGVMEKVSNIVVLPGSFGWSDLGSWTAAWELAERDGRGNALPPSAVSIDSDGCYVYTSAPKKRVALVGVKDLVVVDTEDAVLVIARDRSQDVRAAVDAFQKRGDEEVL